MISPNSFSDVQKTRTTIMMKKKSRFNFKTWKWEQEVTLPPASYRNAAEEEVTSDPIILVAENKKSSFKYEGQSDVEEAVFHLYLK